MPSIRCGTLPAESIRHTGIYPSVVRRRAARAKSGGGLQNIRDRLDVLGGVMDVSSAPGTGACVAGWVPLSTSPKT
jgi:signal transduction histidine kinase